MFSLTKGFDVQQKMKVFLGFFLILRRKVRKTSRSCDNIFPVFRNCSLDIIRLYTIRHLRSWSIVWEKITSQFRVYHSCPIRFQGTELNTRRACSNKLSKSPSVAILTNQFILPVHLVHLLQCRPAMTH